MEEADFLKNKLCDLLKEFKAKKMEKAGVCLTVSILQGNYMKKKKKFKWRIPVIILHGACRWPCRNKLKLNLFLTATETPKSGNPHQRVQQFQCGCRSSPKTSIREATSRWFRPQIASRRSGRPQGKRLEAAQQHGREAAPRIPPSCTWQRWTHQLNQKSLRRLVFIIYKYFHLMQTEYRRVY